MTALSHIQHAQLSAFSFISEGGRVRERSFPGVGISLLTIPLRVDHTEKKNRTGTAVQMHARVRFHECCSYHRNYLTFSIMMLFLICSIKDKELSVC